MERALRSNKQGSGRRRRLGGINLEIICQFSHWLAPCPVARDG